MKPIVLCVCLFMAVLACGAQIITYESKYKGLQVGKATIADVISLLGSPHGKKLTLTTLGIFRRCTYHDSGQHRSDKYHYYL